MCMKRGPDNEVSSPEDNLFHPSNHLRPHYNIDCTPPQSCEECDIEEFLGELAVICVPEDGQKFKEA